MSLFKKNILTAFLLSFVLTSLQAQKSEIAFSHLILGESIATNEIQAIIQNEKGFIWFATSAGLCRFDGSEMKFYKNAANNPNSLCYNRTTSLLEDSNNFIWIGTEVGLSKFDPAAESFTNYEHSIDDPNSLSNNFITSLCEDSYGQIWIGTQNGLNRYDADQNKFTDYFHNPDNPSSLSDSKITVVYKDRRNSIWIGTLDGLNRFDPAKNSFVRYLIKDDKKNRNVNNEIRSIFEDRSGNLWIGTQKSLVKLNRDNGKFKIFDMRNCMNCEPGDFSLNADDEFLIKSIVEDNGGSLWISSQYGIFKLIPQSEELFNYKIFKKRSKSELPNFVNSLFYDRNNIIWLGIYGRGVFYFSPVNNGFNLYSSTTSRGMKITVKSIRAIREIGDDKIIVGGYFGLNIIDRKNKSVKSYLKNEAIYSILPDPDDPQNIFWIGKDVGGLCKFNLETGELIEYKYEKPGLIKGEIIYSLFIGSGGYLWVGTELGINRLDRTNEKADFLGSVPNKRYSLRGSKVNDIFEDESNHIWLASNGGIDIIDLAKGKIRRLFNDPADQSSLSYNNVLCLYKDNSDNLWFGTDGGGLNRYNRKTKRIKRYTTKDGLPNNVIYGILEDEESNLWLSTNNGISKFNINGENFVNFDASSGLLDKEYNKNAYFKSKSGELFFGGISGLVSFFSKDVSSRETTPKVFINSLELQNEKINVGDLRYGKVILNKDIAYTSKVVISYADNFINLSYSSLGASNLSEVNYSYKMKGIDKEWNYVGKRKYASYSSLSPGEYQFNVRAKNLNNKWSSPASLSIIITPPFWRTYWFYLLMGLLTSSVIVLIYRYRINHLMEIERIRVKLASDIHDDLGATLSKISMIAEILKNKIEPETTSEKLTRISELSNKAIESMHDIVWTIDSRNDSFEKIIIKIKDETYNLLRSKNIEVKFDIKLDGKRGTLPLSVKQNLYLIVKEAVNNIYKHSNADRVEISFKIENSKMFLRIYDNGRLFDNSTVHGGNGMKNIIMRAENIGAKLTFQYQKGFTIRLDDIKL